MNIPNIHYQKTKIWLYIHPDMSETLDLSPLNHSQDQNAIQNYRNTTTACLPATNVTSASNFMNNVIQLFGVVLNKYKDPGRF